MTPALRRSDWLASLLLGTWAFVTFANAGDDFSHDFGNYMAYFERLADFSADDLWTQLQAFFPYPYVLIPPAGIFEVGFAALLWSLLGAGMPGAVAYASVGALSIVTRMLLMRALGLAWPTTLLVTVYAITLFEANAIRLGCASTATIAALWAWQRGRAAWGAVLLVLAASFHLQSLAFTLPLVVAAAMFPLLDRFRSLRWLALGVTVSMAAVLGFAPGLVDFAKLAEYAEQQAGSVGLNAASLTGLLALSVASVIFATRAPAAVAAQAREARLWCSTHVAALPALILVLLPLGQAMVRRGGQRRLYLLYNSMLHLCLLVSVVNVTLRYPLSNFFVPLLPYTPITPAILIL